MTQTFAHGYALLIGVGQCAEPTFSLPVAAKDVQALRQILIDPNFCAYPNHDSHVRLLQDQNATHRSILENLNWLSLQAAADPEATVIVYYSGHGWLDTLSDRYYLIPHDFDGYEWRNTALAADDFHHALHQISAKRLLVILDCCHAAGMATAREEIEPRLPKGIISTADPTGFIDALQQGEGRVVFTSCRGEQKSWIRPDNTLSVYTYHLIEALQGTASHAGATEVTVFDLANHLGRAVPESAAALGKQQNPRFEMADTKRFAIALLQGGKGLSLRAGETTQASAMPEQILASGECSGAIGGHASGNTIMTGNNNVTGSGNVVQRGKYNLSAHAISGLQIGDTYLAPESRPGREQPSPQPSIYPGSKPEPERHQEPSSADDTNHREVFISYAWGGKSEEMANQLENRLQKANISLIRDKNHLGFKGRIKAFMERIGRGKCVVLVISEKYLKSENCMFELLQIAKHEQFYERIFPIVLDDARIYKPKDRIQYVQYWEQEIQELDQQIRSVSSAHLEGFREDIDLYNEIRQYLPRLTHILKDMNTLTVQIHSESGFAELIQAIAQKLEE